MSNEIFCPICHKWFKSLGFASHRAKHYRENKNKKTTPILFPSDDEIEVELRNVYDITPTTNIQGLRFRFFAEALSGYHMAIKRIKKLNP